MTARMRRRAIGSGLLVAGLLAAAAAPRATPAPAAASARAAHPDFSGRWALDLARTDYGSMSSVKPRERLDVIAHRDPELSEHSFTVRSSGDTMRLQYRYTTDGREVLNHVIGQDVRSTARWDGAALLIESHTKMLLLDVAVNERWTLRAGGRELVMERRSKLPVGETKQRLVFSRR